MKSFTDSKITKDMYLKGKDRAKLASNIDLCVELFDYIDKKGMTLLYIRF